MEELLLKALSNKDISEELRYIEEIYKDDIDSKLLQCQLPVLKCLLKGKYVCFNDIYVEFKILDNSQQMLVSEVVVLVKLLLVSPASNAMGERSFSTMRRLKTWLRSSMNQCRFNNLAILQVHNERVDDLNLAEVGNEFTSKSDQRKTFLGTFSEQDFRAGL
jgi:hypothetical protein